MSQDAYQQLLETLIQNLVSVNHKTRYCKLCISKDVCVKSQMFLIETGLPPDSTG